MFYAKIVTGKVDIFTTYVKVFLLMKKKTAKQLFSVKIQKIARKIVKLHNNSYSTCYCYHRNLHKKIICKLVILRQNNSVASLLGNFLFLSSFGRDFLSGAGAWLQVLWIIWHRAHMWQCIHFRSHSCWHFLGIPNR